MLHRREEFVSAQVHALPVDEERGRRAGRGHHAADRVIRVRPVLTEALHAMPSGVEVRTCALKVGALRTAGFTRTLRTLESRATVERIMRGGEEGRGEGGWTNGSGNVWLAEAPSSSPPFSSLRSEPTDASLAIGNSTFDRLLIPCR